jgi:peptidylprolyl isomerase
MHKAKLGDLVRIRCCRVPPRGAPAIARVPKTFEFVVGSRDVLRGLSSAVVGMAPGDRKQLTLQPHEAYGKFQQRLVRQLPRERFPRHINLQVGKRLTAVYGVDGRRRRVTIVEIKHDSVVVDANHPLAGKIVELEVSLISLDSSCNANRRKPQFDHGGES